MMDSAALYHAVSPSQTPHQARLCLSMGTNCLRSMARALRIDHNPDPLPTDGLRLTKDEFTDGYRRLVDVEFPVERDLDESWRHFQGWRVNYESIVDELTSLILPPPAPWMLPQPIMGKAEWPDSEVPHARSPRGDSVQRIHRIFKTPSPRNEQLIRLGCLAESHVMSERLTQVGELSRLNKWDKG